MGLTFVTRISQHSWNYDPLVAYPVCPSNLSAITTPSVLVCFFATIHWPNDIFILSQYPFSNIGYLSARRLSTLSLTLHLVLHCILSSATLNFPSLHLSYAALRDSVFTCYNYPSPTWGRDTEWLFSKGRSFSSRPQIVVLLGTVKEVIRAGNDPERDPSQQTKMKQTKKTISNARKPFFMRLSIW